MGAGKCLPATSEHLRSPPKFLCLQVSDHPPVFLRWDSLSFMIA
jgi:hypothetical protein